jgi:hypothetical protein
VLAQVRRLAVRMGLRRIPGVWLLPAPVSPLLLALGGRPRILLPLDLWPRLSDEQQETLLAHELAHLRRRDHWVRRLELVALGLYWWLPVAWWARRKLQDAEEQCCDAWVVAVLPESAPAYASALLETVTFLSCAPLALPVTASGVGHVPLLKRRLTMILRETPSLRLSRLGALAVLAAACLLPLLPTWAEPPAEPRPAPKDPVSPGHGESVRLFQSLQTYCAQCHADPHLHAFAAAEGKHAHDEAVRLFQFLNAPTKEESAGRAGQVQAAEDEIELLKAALEVKTAQLEASQIGRAAADRRLESLERTAKTAPGSIATSELEAVRSEAARMRAECRVREAEVREPLVRLRQAERRLAALKKGAAAPADVKRQQLENRLRDLEKEIRRIQEERALLEKELGKGRN